MNQPLIYLASASPRRRTLLGLLGVSFEVRVSGLDEAARRGEAPARVVERLALEKARAVRKTLPADAAPVLAADTVVVIDDEVLGKPAGRDEAIAMLMRLSGRKHRVLTCVAVAVDRHDRFVTVPSDVVFCELTRDQCEAYWDTGEPADKAGAYAIQGGAAGFVEELKGSYTNVVGLPLVETALLLREFGIDANPDVRLEGVA